MPDSFKWFINEYGYGGVNGALILGVALDKSLVCVEATKELRKYGLPKYLVVIENLEEYVCCLDTSKLIKGECPVVEWDQLGGIGDEYSDNLFIYLYERFTEAIEDL